MVGRKSFGNLFGLLGLSMMCGFYRQPKCSILVHWPIIAILPSKFDEELLQCDHLTASEFHSSNQGTFDDKANGRKGNLCEKKIVKKVDFL